MENSINMMSIYVTVGIALAIQVGSLIWHSATMKAKIGSLTTAVNKLEAALGNLITRQEFEREVKHIWTTINEMKEVK